MGAAVDCLPADQADVGGVVDEVPEAGAQDQLDLGPAALFDRHRCVETAEPVRQQALEHLAVERLLGREVVQQARPPDPDAGGDVVQRRALVPGRGEADDGLVEDQLPRGAGRSGVTADGVPRSGDPRPFGHCTERALPTSR